jgi:hypothetical protein
MEKFKAVLKDLLHDWNETIEIEALDYDEAVRIIDSLCDRSTGRRGRQYEALTIERVPASKRPA